MPFTREGAQVKIDNSFLSLSARYHSEEKHTVEEKLEIYNNNAEQQEEAVQTPTDTVPSDIISISAGRAQAALQASVSAMNAQSTITGLNDRPAQSQPSQARSAIDTEDLENTSDPKLRQLLLLLKKMFGSDVQVAVKKKDHSQNAAPDIQGVIDNVNLSPQTEAGESDPFNGWGMEYSRRESYYERQELTVAAEGTVTTQDGRTIDFSLYTGVESEFQREEQMVIQVGAARKIDPLMINFEGLAGRLTEGRYLFDLNADGAEEPIAFAPQGSGFLFLDKNGDGVATDGSELFGPQSGNGFSELAQYDRDGNNWIDENDSIFDQLKVWAKDAEGIDHIYTLRDRGVGALHLGNTVSQFLFKDSNNELQGELNRLGVFLMEDGIPGTLEQVDLVA